MKSTPKLPPPNIHRIRFFEKQVHMAEWKDTMAGRNEEPVIKILDAIGYKIDEDYVRQHPVGERFVIDFAFINEQVALEVDGANHHYGVQAKKDRKRDHYLSSNNWVSIRLRDNELFGYRGSFYKSLIKEVIDERREQYQTGRLYPIDFSIYYDADYE